MRFKTLLAVLLATTQTGAVSIKGRAISTISDILRQARGIAGKNDADFDLSKHSIIRVHDGQADLRYNIGNGDSDLSRGWISSL